jgi:hypothetical protein
MIVAQVLYLILPFLVAGIAHSAAIKRDLLPALARPLDGGLVIGGRRLLGANKTWRGPVIMCAGCIAAVVLQRVLYSAPGFRTLSLIDYRHDTLALGALFGLAYSLAELPNSFVKRRLGIEPGVISSRGSLLQYTLDQGDSVIGGALVLVLWLHLSLGVVVLATLSGLVLHAVFDQAMYAFGVKHVDTSPGAFTPALGWVRRHAADPASRPASQVQEL